MKINSLRIKNFRGFIDTGEIKLAPINLLIGKNSIGKSSFARIWPLFNQGTKVQKRAPIVWHGPQVDFGSFKEVVSRYASEDAIIFEFNLHVENKIHKEIRALGRFFSRVNTLSSFDVAVITKIASQFDGSNTICKSVTVKLFDQIIVFSYKDDGTLESVYYNNSRHKIENYYSCIYKINFFLPSIDYFIKQPDGIMSIAYSSLRMKLWNLLRSNLHGRLADGRVHEITSQLNIIGTKDDVLQYCKKLNYEYKTWRDFVARLSNETALFEQFYQYVILTSLENFLNDIDTDLKNYFSAVGYIQPLRATAQRDYRRQELAIDDIDPRGENLPFFLETLSDSRLNNLNTWLAEHLQIKIKTIKEKRHVMIQVEDQITGRADNIADMGFGFSQILPLAVQAWIHAPANASKSNILGHNENILIWEQPELHLHPAMQRKLAGLICKTAKKTNKVDTKFMIETHSQSIINEIGDLITEGILSSSDVNIYLFMQDKDNPKETKITKTFFKDDGSLAEWPYGFLAV